jgi:tRNA pseudouridine38-40 synthase
LHNQVRAMVGSLVWVGEGRWSETEIDSVLAARDRRRAGPNAPPWGLYLVAVRY